jgi:hypothetical protein
LLHEHGAKIVMRSPRLTPRDGFMRSLAPADMMPLLRTLIPRRAPRASGNYCERRCFLFTWRCASR